MTRRGIAAVLCALILGLTIYSFQTENSVGSGDLPFYIPPNVRENGNQTMGELDNPPVVDECEKQECSNLAGILGVILLPLIVVGMICATLGASYSAYKAWSRPERKRL